jgi:hypothetical protein
MMLNANSMIVSDINTREHRQHKKREGIQKMRPIKRNHWGISLLQYHRRPSNVASPLMHLNAETTQNENGPVQLPIRRFYL